MTTKITHQSPDHTVSGTWVDNAGDLWIYQPASHDWVCTDDGAMWTPSSDDIERFAPFVDAHHHPRWGRVARVLQLLA